MSLKTAYNAKTGERVPYLVPAHFIGHPQLGPNWVDTPPKKAAAEADKKEKK